MNKLIYVGRSSCRVFLAAISVCAALPLQTWAGDALGELVQASGDMSAVLPSRFATGTHPGLGTALDPSYKPESKYGDYYPFAGDTAGRPGDDGAPLVIPGLLGGMGDESGHPNIFANGGDPRKFWERALASYKKLDFAGAYHDIGILCHLTQDQAAPVHAANIDHVRTFGDNFEAAIGKNAFMQANVPGGVEALVPPAMQPYEYYQVLQDDTRRHLTEWVNPKTKLPYWPPAADAPPLGQDTTKGPWSGYVNGADTYSKSVSPEIIERQTLMAAIYTREVLKTAARLLPPVIGSVEPFRRGADLKSPVDVKVAVYDNRPGKIKLTIERPLYGQSRSEEVAAVSGGVTIPGFRYGTSFATPAPIKGKDLVVVTAEDADGNISKISKEVRYEEPINIYLP